MNYIVALISIVIAQSAGLIGSIFTMKAIPTWYATLVKPSFNPPSWLFGPVWTLLYALMGVSAGIIWRHRDVNGAKLALWVYGIQLALNALWSILFFGMRSPVAAFTCIVVLWLLILLTTILFWRINTTAGALLIPYLAWVSFASVLNYSIWMLNK